jgi:hypothetical protein
MNKKEIYLRHRVEKRNWEETYRQDFQSMTKRKPMAFKPVDGLTPEYQLIVPALYKCKDHELEELSRYCLQLIHFRKDAR